MRFRSMHFYLVVNMKIIASAAFLSVHKTEHLKKSRSYPNIFRKLKSSLNPSKEFWKTFRKFYISKTSPLKTVFKTVMFTNPHFSRHWLGWAYLQTIWGKGRIDWDLNSIYPKVENFRAQCLLPFFRLFLQMKSAKRCPFCEHFGRC